MVKEKVDMAKQQALEQENILLRKKLDDAEALAAKQKDVPHFDNLTSEIKKIRAKGKPSANSIVVREVIDHKNISLWTKLGKRIGPMHPDNAIQTLHRFADIGIILTADQPAQTDIDAYKQTAEFKELEKKEIERRAIKDKSRKSGQIEKLAKEIAKMSGTTVDAINHILKMHEVKSLSPVK